MMNAYPPELLGHHYPCMLVTGLVPLESSAAPVSSPIPQSSFSPTQSGKTETPPTAAPDADATALNSSSTSAPPAAAAAQTTGDPTAAIQDPSDTSKKVKEAKQVKHGSHPTQAYPDLCRDLAEIFTSRGANGIWDPARGRSTVFHSVLVQHNIKLPPLKTKLSSKAASTASAPSAAPAASAANGGAVDGTGRSPGSFTNPLPAASDAATALAAMTPRSPLSPLHPGGPLFPDGLIAPIWARKHREMVPAVFVSFFCLAEKPGGSGAEQTAESGAFLRRNDEDLIRQIKQRKRSLTERGIKMTVVLLTTRGMLEDPQLEGRLSYVRRSSGLDSKASLFVLTPVSKQELVEFVVSLHKALHESALDFYREHARRVRRKRARYPPPPSVIQPILNAAAALSTVPVDLVPLSRGGWIVRAEYKLATFAELQGDNDEALQRYLEAYNILSGPCLGSTMMLPPRTKRWAEAKVLADTLSIKIAKLHLYRDDGAAAVRQLHRHLHRFTELSTGWGIGSMTFEYWSWLCKQYRMFADLVEAATRHAGSSLLPPFALPSHAPPLPSRLLHPDVVPRLQAGMPVPPGMLTPNQSAVMSGVSPASVIQGPGTFYYLAALCTLERRDRFDKLVAAEQLGPEDVAKHPSLSHEQKVNYTSQITEQFTRAYDCFKRQRSSRLALLIASRIALTYLEGGKHEMALRFLERILRSYRIDGCVAIQSWLTQLAAGCADHVDDVESCIRLFIDLILVRLNVPEQERSIAESRLVSILDGSAGKALPEGKVGPVRIESDATKGLLVVESDFLDEYVEVGSPAAFQLRLMAPKGSKISSIAFASIEIAISGFERPLIVRLSDKPSASDSFALQPSTEIADVGLVSSASLAAKTAVNTHCGLRWTAGSTKVLQGSIVANLPGPLEISSITLRTGGAGVSVELVFDLSTSATAARVGEINAPRWLLPFKTKKSKGGRTHRFVSIAQRESSNVIRVRPCAYKLDLSASHLDSAYLDEGFPVVLKVTNRERITLECAVDMALQAAYEGMDDTLQCGTAAASQQVRAHQCGTVAPGETVEVPFVLKAARREGERTVDVVVHSWPKTAEGGQANDGEGRNRTSSEKTLSIHVPVFPAFGVTFTARWQKSRQGRPVATRGLLDFFFSSDSSSSDTDGDEALMSVTEDTYNDDDDDLPIYTSAAISASLAAEPERRGVLVGTTLTMLGQSTVHVHAVEVKVAKTLPDSAAQLRIAKGFDAGREHEDLLGSWDPDDRFGVSYPFVVRPTPSAADGPTTPTAHLIITWSRSSAPSSSHNHTVLPLSPTLFRPPPPPLVLSVTPVHPSTMHLRIPFSFSLLLHNHTPRTVSLLIVVESNDSFVFAGPRRLAIPHLLAGEERKVDAWNMVPLRVGRVEMPKLKVIRREREGEKLLWSSNDEAAGEVDVLLG